MKNPIVIMIRGYQILISPFLGHRCRFLPSCSHYATEAINNYGTLKGGFFAIRRICKCHPFHAGGYDPVPGTEQVHKQQPDQIKK